MKKFNIVVSDGFKTWEEEISANTVSEAVDIVANKYSNDEEVYILDVEKEGNSCWLEYQYETAANC